VNKETDILIKVEGLSKKFCTNLNRSLIYGFRDMASAFLVKSENVELRKDEFWALKDISFEIRRGECLGLIGHNGAGKSTLLKLLNGLIRPDAGSIEMCGRVGALIELGAGFSPLLSGRENVYINGSILGLSRDEIDEKYDEIVEFAELADFMDTPIQNYSSGMKVRLGFAIAAQVNPDILLIDEVLAVGDMGFTLKCFNQMDKLLRNTAIILVSHSIPQVARMATKLFVLERGKSIFFGIDVSEGINLYYSKFGNKILNVESNTDAILEKIWIEREDGVVETINDNFIIPSGMSINIFLKIKTHIEIKSPEIYIAFYDREQRNFAEVNNFPINPLHNSLKKGDERVYQIQFGSMNLAQGLFSIAVALGENDISNRKNIFRIQSAIYFQVTNAHHGWAPFQFQPKWQIV
jgi:lipopolysaccharide transport system ATP-binding protein